MIQPAVAISHLTFRYPDGRSALSDVTLQVSVGERVAVVGPNGAGKSTLLLHLNGLLPEKPAEEPCVHVLGLPVIRKNFPAVRTHVGLLFQNPDDQLFCPTVGEDVAFGLRQRSVSEAEISERVAAALTAVSLQGFEDRPPSKLSLGEKKRACLAGLLAGEATILALDEPTASLDARSRRSIVNLLDSLSQTMVIATHDLALARELCQRVVVLDDGVVRADGRPEVILSDEDLLRRHGLTA